MKYFWFYLLETSNNDADSSVMTSCVNINTRRVIIRQEERQICSRNCCQTSCMFGIRWRA